MNPSALVKSGGKTYVVNYQHSWTFKKDRIGRRIKGSERSTGWIGVTVSEYDQGPKGPVKEYPPMTAQDAVKRYIDEEQNLSAPPQSSKAKRVRHVQTVEAWLGGQAHDQRAASRRGRRPAAA